MKIAFLISGFIRTFIHNFPKNKKLFDKYECDYYLHLSNNESIDQYKNTKYNINNIIDLIKPKHCIIQDEISFNDNNDDNNKLLNQKRMWYKIYQLNQLKKIYEDALNMKYDMVIRIRPDILIMEDNINFSKYKLDNNTIYGFQTKDRFNDEFNFGSSCAMDKYANIFLSFNNYTANYADIKILYLLKTYCILQKINMNHSNIKYKLLLTLCNIVAIAGGSGSGKTTLMKYLKNLFTDNILQLECDRYHKWERNDPHWGKFTHLNPDANYISKMSDDVFNLKVGNDIYQVDYDHSNGKFTESKKIETKKNVVICGLHTLFNKNINELLNFKIYLDTDEKLRRFWKIKRDTVNRGYSIEKIVQQIESRVDDFDKYIKPQMKISDLIINFFTDNNFNYMNLTNEPNVYLQLSVKHGLCLLSYIQILNEYNIMFSLNVTNNYNTLIFKTIDFNFNNVLNNIILKYCKEYSFIENTTTYYTIIMSLIIYLNK